MASYPSSEVGHGKRWATFALVLFLTLGALNIIDGIAALAKDSQFKADELLLGGLAFWGTVYLIVGLLQVLTAFLIWRGSFAGSLIGLSLASINAIVALLSVGAYPLWSVIILIGDGVVIYALTVYGDAFRSSRT
jgi:hypothetical protein